jgi:adenylosuccinate lyase
MKKVWTDENKFAQWLKVEIAACEAWSEQGVISKPDLARIRKAKFDPVAYDAILKITHHDVTAFLKSVGKSLGPESRFIHLGMTSSDVMDTALSLQLLEASDILIEDAKELIGILRERAIEHKMTLQMGRTHGVHAEPITFGLKMALWSEEMKRHLHRLEEARRVIGVGKVSGAVGTYATIPPQIEIFACRRLGLEPAPVSNQVLQRDRHAQFVTTLAIVAASLEKFATEIRALQKTETLEAEEPFDAGQTGSSAMPHKRNPELCERVCGLARLIRGFAVTSLENVALWHERDISHSSNERITLPDSCLALDYIFSLMIKIMRGLQVYPQNMRHNLEVTQGLVFSQRVLLALIDKGLTRDRAYELVQRNAMQAWKERTPFLDLLAADPDVARLIRKAELKAIFDYNYYTRHIDEVFERLGLLPAKVRRPSGKNTK